MPGPEMGLKRELFEAGSRLLKPPGSVDDLLPLLDRVEHCLSFVEQQPPVEMQDALCPAFKALVTQELMKHADIDVRVGVTACLTEISRITAPDVPYGDQLMKDVFRLTISAFEGLSDESSKSFGKRVSILETVASVRSCAVLLDLDCDDLVVEMFQNFYKCIRDFHTAKVFTSMESIMTLVIEEYDEISADLLFALISVLKRENKDAAPVAKRLGEKVVQRCANKLKSCIIEAIKSLKIDLIDYDFVVTLACQSAPDHDPFRELTPNVPLVNGGESPMKTFEKEAAFEVFPSLAPHIHPIVNTVTVDEDAAAEEMLNTSHQLDSNVVGCATETIQDQVQVGPAALTSDMVMNADSVSLPKSEPKSEKNSKKRGRKPVDAKDIVHTDSSKLIQPDVKKASESQVSETNVCMEVLEAHHNDSSMDPNVPEKSCDSSIQRSPNVVEKNVISLGSPSQTDSPTEKSSSETVRRSEQPVSVQEATSSHQISERKPSDELNDSETVQVSVDKVMPDEVGDASKFVSSVNVKNEQDIEGDSPLGTTDGTLRSKKRGRPRKDASMSAATGVKEGISSEGTSWKRSRLRFTFPEDGKLYREELIGSRIKVWWPRDKEYYDGIVEAYDRIKRKHTILYTDNERESLRLHKQKWKLLKSSIGSEKDQVTACTNAGEASDKQQGKKLNTDSSSAGTMGNTESPLKRRRGRPPKNYVALTSCDSSVRGTMSEGQIKSNEKNDSVADDVHPLRPMDSMPQCAETPILSPENTEQDVTPVNVGTQTKKNTTMGTGVVDTAAPTAAVRFGIDDPFTYKSDDEFDVSETATPKTGNADVSVAEEVKSGSAIDARTAGLNLKLPAFGTGISSRKRKPRTSSHSNSPAVSGSTDTLTKKRRGRPPYKFLLQNSIEESKDLSKQLGDPKVDGSRSIDCSDDVAVVKPKCSMDGSRNAPYVSVAHKLTMSTPDSPRNGNKEEAAPAQNSSKTAIGEVKFGSPTGLKIKFKTTVPEPVVRRRRSRKITSSPAEQLNKDGSVKRPRGRPPYRLKIEVVKPDSKAEGNVSPRAPSQHRADDVKADSIYKAEISLGNSSDPTTKKNPPSVSNVNKDPLPADAGVKDKKIGIDIASTVGNRVQPWFGWLS